MNLMVQSEFNLVFWFVSYNIFLVSLTSRAHLGTLQLMRVVCLARHMCGLADFTVDPV
jgi:hypothetical protein